MISEKNASMIAFAFSIIGFTALLLLNLLESPQEIKISEIQGIDSGTVQVNARIASVKLSKNALYLRLFDGNSLNAVVYSPSAEILQAAEENSLVSAAGSLRKNPSGNGKTLIVSRLWRIA